MGGEDNELTLQELAQRLETLERENERMRSENAELREEVADLKGTRRGEVAELRGPAPRRTREPAAESSESDGLVSRRSLLSKAGAAAVGAVVAGMLLDPRKATADHFNDPSRHDTFTTDAILTHRLIAEAGELIGTAVYGSTVYEHGSAVIGFNRAQFGIGVQGSTNGFGGKGVWGITEATDATGVRGEGDTGVWGSSSRTGWSGVYGQHTGTAGYGIVGDGSGWGAGVLGRNPDGYGGQFEGGKAQLKLKLGGSAGAPTGDHSEGEIYMDSAGALFVCVKGGSPATWEKVSTTAV